ncbi:hypothetical protein BU26DRAFT_245187 [Trematosphaeria pertusa]|uniref:Uncharacterized protein n=1 Tax=Trematosphaeria pertusa TaxID=390896 RepID=A0A6A6IPV6_9PLEO|nr:uncharacterized protein BU26DRAFT_245187 [Trematosphaeria pertusa]KAF2251822.1 hypothetical protein BU26DRAFT_245187 [Trematosphaeria pertusa]
MDGERSLHATCEDYHSDDSEDHVLESFRRSPAANVAAKRSHPSDLGTDKPPGAEKVANIDLQSDSGYSSHTAATMSSADSAPSAKSSQSPPAAPASAASMPPPSPATSKRRPTIVAEDRKASSQNSPRKPLARSGSVTSKRTAGSRRQTVSEECRNPNCTKCGPNALPSRGRRPQPSPLDSGLDVSYPPFDQRSQRSDPASSQTSPPSPTYTRQPAPYMQGSALMQPGQARRRSSSNARRPLSYQGDPGPNYWVPGMPAPYPSPPHEHGPPPAMSAHWSMQQPQHAQMSPYLMGATPPNYYPPGHPMAQTSPPYDLQRPPLSARGSYQTGRPTSGFGPTLVTYEQSNQPMPSARYPNAPQSARQERFQFESGSSDDESSEEDDYEPDPRNDRALMPPPKLKSTKNTKERRPSLRHANTTQVYNERRMSQSQTLPERPRERDPRASRVSTAVPSRAPSVSRPNLVQHPKAQSSYETTRSAYVTVEDPRARRRRSVQTYGKQYEAEQKRQNRDSKIYQDGLDEILVSDRRRRRTDADTVTKVQYYPEEKDRRVAMDAEAYQRHTRGSNAPVIDQVHRDAKNKPRVPSGPSEGSSRSSDKKSRVSQSNRTTVTNGGGNGEIRLRVDASAPLSLSFNGDMEGRTLQINPADNGMADIVIGSSRGSENMYRSERGSVLGSSKKSLVANPRRDAEESSVRSGRSSQGRREGERRVLRRRRDTEYS